MRIIYPYNEILPKKKAHDVFIFHECAALAAQGAEVTLLIGKGSPHAELFTHYNALPSDRLTIETLFMIRKNNPLGISWNLPFFYLCQRYIRKTRPNVVILSVRKQAAYHLLHKLPRTRYVYEVHELAYYPNQPEPHPFEVQFEKAMLSRADLITVTTAALKEILTSPPYSLKTRIEVVPLAVQAKPLLPPPPSDHLQLAYVGQLYAGQGLTTLLAALAKVQKVDLKVLGGTSTEIAHLEKLAKELGIGGQVIFFGFVPPQRIPEIVQGAHAFVAPFENTGRMPYVAHTKLSEYAEWGRPLIAPDLSIVREHFDEGTGALLFEPGNPTSLAGCIQILQKEAFRAKLQEEALAQAGRFSWPTRAQTYLKLIESL